MMGSPASAVNPLTQSVGFNARLVKVTQIDYTKGLALAVDQMNVQVSVPIYVSRANGRLPAVGETWFVDQSLGLWTFAARVGQSDDDFKIISGTAGGRRIELDENGLRYYRADGTLMVNIDTTADIARVISETPNPLTLQNGWVVNTAPSTPGSSYWKLPFDAVRVVVNAINGTSTDGTVIATLPTGYRPGTNHIFPITVAKTPAAGTASPSVTVRPDGGLQLAGVSAGGSSAQVAFDIVCPVLAPV